MKVIFIKPGAAHGYGHFAGDTAEIKKKDAEKLANKGVVKAIEAPEFPEDMPGADELAAAGVKFEEVKGFEAAQLIEITGIGEATAAKILEYLG